MRPLNAAWRAVLGNARHRPKLAATRLPQAVPQEVHAEVLFSSRARYKYAPVLERPPLSYGKQLELVKGLSTNSSEPPFSVAAFVVN
jgi:hypothetical protein